MIFTTRHYRLTALGATLGLVICGFFLTNCKKFEVSQAIILKTEGVSEVTVNSCRVAGSLLDAGSTGVSMHGFCWSLTPNPAEAISCNNLGARSEKGAFTSIVENLQPGTHYYTWAYAESSEEREYGKAREFTTLSATLATVETGGITNVTVNSAIISYNIVSNGGSQVTERGLCWGTTPSPSVDGFHQGYGSGTGQYSDTISELVPNTDYYVRAYARNSIGVGYGADRTFGTPAETSVPVVHTQAVENVTATTVLVKGTIGSDGGAAIVEKGFCWDTETGPTKDKLFEAAGSGTDPFESTISGLLPNSSYYVRAYATNSAGIAYGEELEFTTPSAPLVDERNGKSYQTIKIGDQIWMAENLDIGTKIDGSLGGSNDGYIEKYCYENNDAYCDQYGAMYNWEEMMQYNTSEGAQGVCPAGWHIPSDEEWKILEMALGMSSEEADATDYRGTDQGGKLKATGLELWDAPNEGATNESGFNALPAGGMDYTGYFGSQGYFTYFWTSSWDGTNPWYRLLDANHETVYRSPGLKGYATSVRCVKN